MMNTSSGDKFKVNIPVKKRTVLDVICCVILVGLLLIAALFFQNVSHNPLLSTILGNVVVGILSIGFGVVLWVFVRGFGKAEKFAWICPIIPTVILSALWVIGLSRVVADREQLLRLLPPVIIPLLMGASCSAILALIKKFENEKFYQFS